MFWCPPVDWSTYPFLYIWVDYLYYTTYILPNDLQINCHVLVPTCGQIHLSISIYSIWVDYLYYSTYISKIVSFYYIPEHRYNVYTVHCTESIYRILIQWTWIYEASSDFPHSHWNSNDYQLSVLLNILLIFKWLKYLVENFF